MAVRELHFVRHGESEHHVRGMTGGWTDTPLTPRGVRQVESAARYLSTKLRQEAPATIIASDLARARQSAEIIALALGADVVTTPLLREINNGVARDLTIDEANKIKRAEPATRALDYRAFDGAETFAELYERARDALSFITAIDLETCVVVGHGLSGQCLLQCWLGIELDVNIAFHLDPASCSHVVVNQWGERQVRRLNYCRSETEFT